MKFTHLDSGISYVAGACVMTPAHKYVTPQGHTYSSVTTVLGATKPDTTGLDEWRKRMGSDVADYILRQSAIIGTAAHKLNEIYLNNGQTLQEEKGGNHNTPLLARAHHENFVPYLQRINNIRGNEIILWSDVMCVAGTSDCIAEYDDILSIIDYKTKRSPQREEWIADYYTQAAAYSMMYKELTGVNVTQAVVLVSSEADTMQEFVVNLAEYKQPFLERLRKYQSKEIEREEEQRRGVKVQAQAQQIPSKFTGKMRVFGQ